MRNDLCCSSRGIVPGHRDEVDHPLRQPCLEYVHGKQVRTRLVWYTCAHLFKQLCNYRLCPWTLFRAFQHHSVAAYDWKRNCPDGQPRGGVPRRYPEPSSSMSYRKSLDTLRHSHDAERSPLGHYLASRYYRREGLALDRHRQTRKIPQETNLSAVVEREHIFRRR